MRFTYTHPKYGTKVFDQPVAEIIIGRPSPGQHVDLDLTPDPHVSHRHARTMAFQRRVEWYTSGAHGWYTSGGY